MTGGERETNPGAGENHGARLEPAGTLALFTHAFLPRRYCYRSNDSLSLCLSADGSPCPFETTLSVPFFPVQSRVAPSAAFFARRCFIAWPKRLKIINAETKLCSGRPLYFSQGTCAVRDSSATRITRGFCKQSPFCCNYQNTTSGKLGLAKGS